MARRKSPFRMSDVTRAAKALTAAGYMIASVMIAPDGSIQMTTTVAAQGSAPVTASAAPHDPDEDATAALLADIERLVV